MDVKIKMPKLDDEKMAAHIVALIGIYDEGVVEAAQNVSKTAAKIGNCDCK